MSKTLTKTDLHLALQQDFNGSVGLIADLLTAGDAETESLRKIIELQNTLIDLYKIRIDFLEGNY